MNKRKDSLKKKYLHFLFAGVGSAVIITIYSLVDAVMVGQYEGVNGSAALSVIMPIWTIILSIGLLFGVGGGVLMSKSRGEGNIKRGNEIFTRSFISVVIVDLFCWILMMCFEKEMLILFGADNTILPLAMDYIDGLKYSIPLFTMGQFLIAFIRNDNAPSKTMVAVIAGGVFNIFGDYYLVFVMDMGIKGAGIATALGEVLCIIILCTHFFSKKNNLKFVKSTKEHNFFVDLKHILWAGFSVFIVDIASGVMMMLFNNRIIQYLNSQSLAIYGVLANIFMFTQSISYGVGQATQPILSLSYGAGNYSDIKKLNNYGKITAFIIAFTVTFLVETFPMSIVNLFMSNGDSLSKIAPKILRIYALSFILMPRNIFFTYYFQSVMYPKESLFISLLRGILIGGILIFVLPLIWGAEMLWWVMPITEFVTYFIGIILEKRCNKKLFL